MCVCACECVCVGGGGARVMWVHVCVRACVRDEKGFNYQIHSGSQTSHTRYPFQDFTH